MRVKGIMLRDVVSSRGDISLQQAIEILYRKHAGSIVVLDEEEKCRGIFTTRDAIRAIAMKADLQTPLRDVMTRRVLTIREDASFAEAKEIMVKRNIRHLPVRNKEGKIVGIVTMRNIMDELIGYRTVKNRSR